MNKNRLWIVLTVLAMAAMACSALGGAGTKATSTPADSSVAPTDVPASGDDTSAPEPTEEPATDDSSTSGDSYDTEFPLPDDVSNFFLLEDGMVSFQTKMSLKDALTFYKDALTAEGYTERSILTATSDTTFSTVFDGHSSGKAIVIQAVDLGSGSINITIRFEAVN